MSDAFNANLSPDESVSSMNSVTASLQYLRPDDVVRLRYGEKPCREIRSCLARKAFEPYKRPVVIAVIFFGYRAYRIDGYSNPFPIRIISQLYESFDHILIIPRKDQADAANFSSSSS